MQYLDLMKKECEDTAHMINMIPVKSYIQTGVELGLNENHTVLDLCCGYGTALKLWAEAFGIRGTGVDITPSFIEKGKQRIADAEIDTVQLICGDARTYKDDTLYDIVSCSETLGSNEETLALMERFKKPDGKLMVCRVFSTAENPPEELTDFEGPLMTLEELHSMFRGFGYYVSNIASDDRHTWDHYISWEAARTLRKLRSDDPQRSAAWYEKWFHMYFKYRRPYEGMALFVLEK